jgi:hypothetical protein
MAFRNWALKGFEVLLDTLRWTNIRSINLYCYLAQQFGTEVVNRTTPSEIYLKKECVVAHATAYHNLDLAQIHAYRPKASQGSAPNAGARQLNLCHNKDFSLTHGIRLSQNAEPNRLSDNRHPIGDSWVIALAGSTTDIETFP